MPKRGDIKKVMIIGSGSIIIDDSYIRKAAIKHKVPYITTLAAAAASAKGIEENRGGSAELKSLQEYHAGIKPKGE